MGGTNIAKFRQAFPGYREKLSTDRRLSICISLLSWSINETGETIGGRPCFVQFKIGNLFRDPLQPFDHAQHGEHRDETCHHKQHPGGGHRHIGVEDGADKQ